MMSTFNAWEKLARLTAKSKALTLRILPPAIVERIIKSSSQCHDIPPLIFPELPSYQSHLLQLGVDEEIAKALSAQFAAALQKLDSGLTQQYHNEAPKFCELNVSPELESRAHYIQAIQNYLHILRTQAAERLSRSLLSCPAITEALKVQLNCSPTTDLSTINCAPSSKRKRQGRPSPFTAQQTFALNALLAHDDHYSPEAKDYIAEKLGLTRDQVNRWFCNARARKKQVCHPPRGQSLDSVRTVSSDFSDIQSNANSQTGFLSDNTHSTPNNSDRSPSLAFSVPDHVFASQGPNSVSDMPQSTNPTIETNSMDDYMDYAAYLEPQSNDSLEMSIPMDVTSSVDPQPVSLNSQLDHAMEPSLDVVSSFNDPLFQPFNFNPDRSLLDLPSKPPEPSASNEDFLNFDLSNWGFLS